MFEEGEHRNKKGREKIKEIKLKMNDNRKEINWDHLNKFYSIF